MKLRAFFFILPLAALALPADWHVRGAAHIPGGYRQGHVVADADIASEWWFARDKVAYATEGWAQFGYSPSMDWRLILDAGKKRLLLINLTEKWYCEIDSEQNPLSLFEPRFAQYFQSYRMGGKITPMPGYRSIIGRGCSGYRLEEWQEGSPSNHIFESESLIQASVDLPFDLRPFTRLREWLMAFIHPEETYRDGLRTVKGFILEAETTIYELAGNQSLSFRVIEIVRADPPSGAYGPPAGLERRKTIHPSYIMQMLALFYPTPIF